MEVLSTAPSHWQRRPASTPLPVTDPALRYASGSTHEIPCYFSIHLLGQKLRTKDPPKMKNVSAHKHPSSSVFGYMIIIVIIAGYGNPDAIRNTSQPYSL
jgi:hypothetical protein